MIAKKRPLAFFFCIYFFSLVWMCGAFDTCNPCRVLPQPYVTIFFLRDSTATQGDNRLLGITVN